MSGEWLDTSKPQRHQLGCWEPLVAAEGIPAKSSSSCIIHGTRNHGHQAGLLGGHRRRATPVMAAVWVGLPGRWLRGLKGPVHSRGSTGSSAMRSWALVSLVITWGCCIPCWPHLTGRRKDSVDRKKKKKKRRKGKGVNYIDFNNDNRTSLVEALSPRFHCRGPRFYPW